MEIWQHFQHFSLFDGISVLVLITLWLLISAAIENPNARSPSVSKLMEHYRKEWFIQFMTRENRVFDATLLGSLRAGTTFFASACMIAIGGLLTLLGNSDSLIGVARDLSLGTDPEIVWEIKLILVLFFVTNGFFKFVWAHRLFGYCSVVAAAVPNAPDAPNSKTRCEQAAQLNITASRSYTRGMRLVYFALAALAWLAGPLALTAAALFTSGVLIRREFASQSRKILMNGLGL